MFSTFVLLEKWHDHVDSALGFRSQESFQDTNLHFLIIKMVSDSQPRRFGGEEVVEGTWSPVGYLLVSFPSSPLRPQSK